MKTLLFVHGWGFDASFWRPLAERLPDFRREAVEMGFRAAERHVPQVERPIVVGHSLGFAWALANVPGPWAGAVAINAFPRFTRAPDFVEGVAPRMVERMLAKFADEPAAVTADFLARCGVEGADVSDIRPGPLGEALAWLGICDERRAFARLDCPLLALAGTRDQIVPESMSRAAFAATGLTLVEGAGHLLPLTHAEGLASQVRLFASRL